MKPVSVSTLSEYIKSVLRDDLLLSNVTVRGELSSFKETARGHCFFSIKDERSVLQCALFESCPDSRLPESIGMEVDVQGNISTFPMQSGYRMLVKDVRLHTRQGQLHQQLEQRRKKLQDEGLFDREKKRPIPAFPHRIGLITSGTGAAITDLLHVIRRRSPMTHVVLYPTVVQGTSAPASMIAAIRYFDKRDDISTVIIGRGGGSFEDLFGFNDEALVRAVGASRHPIISAVGHESDTVLTDFAADLRAPTPTAAGELATRDVSELENEIYGWDHRLQREIRAILDEKGQLLDAVREDLLRRNPAVRMEKMESDLREWTNRLTRAVEETQQAKEHALSVCKVRLDASNPLAILHKGYAVVQKNGSVVTDSSVLAPGDALRVRFLKGQAQTEVTEIFTQEESHGV